MLNQTIAFVHPWAILAAKNEEPSVDLPFDLKIKSEFKIDKLLEVNVKLADNMRANFNKKLDNLAKEAFKFMTTSVIDDDDYVEPADDTQNIANGANYLPNWGNFVPGGEVFTNYFAASSATRRIPKTSWGFTIALDILRWISGNSAWAFDPKIPVSFWIFKTRDNSLDTLLP